VGVRTDAGSTRRDRLARVASHVEADEQVARCAGAQHGAVEHGQVRRAGLTQRQVDLRVAAGRLVRSHPRVFVIAGAPATWEQSVMAAVLAGGAGAIASHSTAAALWSFPDAEREAVIEITVPRPRLPRLRGVRVHRSVAIEDDDVAMIGAIATTAVPRTLIDLTAVRGLGWIARALDDAVRRNLTTLRHARACADRLRGAPGRRPSVLRLLVAERFEVGGGKTESWLERVVLGVLLDAGIPAPEPQFPVVVDGHRYRLDFAWPDQRVALEVDGFGPHSAYGAFHDDRRRDLLLRRKERWRVLHVTAETPAPEIIASVVPELELPAALEH